MRVIDKKRNTILVLSNVFPSAFDNKGTDIKDQILALRDYFQVIVVKSLPLFLGSKKVRFNEIDKIQVLELPYLCIPKIGVFLNGLFYYIALYNVFRYFLKEARIAMVLSFWTYPEGFG